jgi:nitrite reductase/ring-hydroxylating ferredoxin subunit
VSGRRLCRADEIAEGVAKGFEDAATGEGRVIVIRRAGRFHAYRNVCPHQGTPLNFLPDRFLDRVGRRLLCTTHGALFRIEDGLCLAGPCRGAHLERVTIEEAAGELRLAGGASEIGGVSR